MLATERHANDDQDAVDDEPPPEQKTPIQRDQRLYLPESSYHNEELG